MIRTILETTTTQLVSYFVEMRESYFFYVRCSKHIRKALLLHKTFIPLPFTVHNQFQSLRGKDIYSYGQTPLSIIEHLITNSVITTSDTVIDIGCGDGRVSLYLACMGIKSVGIDHCSYFINQLNSFKSAVDREIRQNIDYKKCNFFDQALPSATIAFIYQLDIKDNDATSLGDSLKASGIKKVICIGFAISEYSDYYTFVKKIPCWMPFGLTGIYVCKLTNVP